MPARIDQEDASRIDGVIEMAERSCMDLDVLERHVVHEVESYRYEVPEGALGGPLPDDEVERLLIEMRVALVKPEWRVVEFESESRACVLVADDREGWQLYFDPAERDFFLASGDPPTSIGVRGGAVGCFMAR